MGTRHGTMTRAALLVLAIAVAACASPTSPSSSPPSSPALSASSELDPAGSTTAPSLDQAILGDSIVPLADRELAAHTDHRLAADMVGYLGPDATALTAEMDRQETDAMKALAYGSTSDTTGALAAVHLPQAPGRTLPAAAPPPGMSFLGPWVTSLAILDAGLAQGASSSTPKPTTSEIAIGPNKGTVTTQLSSKVVPTGSRLVIDVDYKTSGEVSDANGALVFRIQGTGHAHLDVQGCPDAQGVAPATLEFTGDELYFVGAGDAGSSGHSWRQEDVADARIFASDEAALDHQTIDMKTKQAVKGGTRGPGADQSSLTASTIDIGTSVTITPGQGGVPTVDGTINYNGHGTTRAEIDKAIKADQAMVYGSVQFAATAAEKFWRSGKCVEVVVDPNSKDVDAGSKTTVTARVRHRFDGGELAKPVEASMTGVASIAPAGQRQPAPATFTFTAGSKMKDAGVVTFKSVSNRGIGETTATYTVGGAWKLHSQDGTGLTVTGQKCNGIGGVWRVDGAGSALSVVTKRTWTATISEQSLAGTYTYKGSETVRTQLGTVVTLTTGTGKATIVVKDDGSVVLTFGATSVTSSAAGQTLQIPTPALPLTWAPGGNCPSP